MYLWTSIDKEFTQVTYTLIKLQTFPGPQKASSGHFQDIPQPLQRNQYCAIYRHKLGLPLLEHQKHGFIEYLLFCVWLHCLNITFLRFSLIDDITIVSSFYCCVLFHYIIASFSTLPLKNIQVVPVWGSFSGGSLICSFDLQSILTQRLSRLGSAGCSERPCFLYENRTCFRCKKQAVIR